MIIYISCAKIMTGNNTQALSFATEPKFQLQANENAVQMAAYSPTQLKELLKTNADIALPAFLRS